MISNYSTLDLPNLCVDFCVKLTSAPHQISKKNQLVRMRALSDGWDHDPREGLDGTTPSRDRPRHADQAKPVLTSEREIQPEKQASPSAVALSLDLLRSSSAGAPADGVLAGALQGKTSTRGSNKASTYLQEGATAEKAGLAAPCGAQSGPSSIELRWSSGSWGTRWSDPVRADRRNFQDKLG